MTTPTAVATTPKPAAAVSLPPEVIAQREALKQKNAAVQALRGAVWSKDLTDFQQRAMANWAHSLGIDPMRHMEVLGGRPYLTAEFYREKGAPLLRAGVVAVLGAEHINDDPRFAPNEADSSEMAAWKRQQREVRLRLRIQHNVPEAAKGAVIFRLRVTATGEVVEGVNWCGQGGKRDPVGDAEPAKTAESRAERRAWRHLVDVLPEVERTVGPVIRRVEAVVSELAEDADAKIEAPKGPTPILALPDGDPYNVAGQAGEGADASA